MGNYAITQTWARTLQLYFIDGTTFHNVGLTSDASVTQVYVSIRMIQGSIFQNQEQLSAATINAYFFAEYLCIQEKMSNFVALRHYYDCLMPVVLDTVFVYVIL